MSGRDEDLVADEGVDEGSAASTAESAGSGGDVVGTSDGEPATEQDAAPPLDLGGTPATAPGQQLAAGEG